MEAREAIEILHPDTVAEALAKYRRIGGYKEIKKATDEACLLACEALEKQVPKKVIFEDDGEVLLCPNCGIDFMGSLSDPDHDPYYCFECGQAILWEE